MGQKDIKLAKNNQVENDLTDLETSRDHLLDFTALHEETCP